MTSSPPGGNCARGEQCTGGSYCRAGWCSCPETDMVISKGECVRQPKTQQPLQSAAYSAPAAYPGQQQQVAAQQQQYASYSAAPQTVMYTPPPTTAAPQTAPPPRRAAPGTNCGKLRVNDCVNLLLSFLNRIIVIFYAGATDTVYAPKSHK